MREDHRLTLTLCVALCLGALLGPGAAYVAAQRNEWRASMRVIEFGYGGSVFQTEYDYNVYQDLEEVVRQELTYMSRNPVAEVGRDVHLIDYRNGIVLAFTKHSSKALKYKIEEPGVRSSLGERRILNHLCQGARFDLNRSDGSVHVSDQWVMADGDFKEPLLRVEYNLGPKKELLTLTVAAVTQLATAKDLPPSLFAAPGGLDIRDGPPGPPY